MNDRYKQKKTVFLLNIDIYPIDSGDFKVE